MKSQKIVNQVSLNVPDTSPSVLKCRFVKTWKRTTPKSLYNILSLLEANLFLENDQELNNFIFKCKLCFATFNKFGEVTKTHSTNPSNVI